MYRKVLGMDVCLSPSRLLQNALPNPFTKTEEICRGLGPGDQGNSSPRKSTAGFDWDLRLSISTGKPPLFRHRAFSALDWWFEIRGG